MHKYALCLVAATWFAATVAHAGNVGFKQKTLTDLDSDRPLEIAILYPAANDGKNEIVGETPAWTGLALARDAAPLPGQHPLVVVSHGYGGTWRNQLWLAHELARRGYVVAAPNHPGTTAFDRSPRQAARLSERPRDLTRVIDALLADPAISGDIDPMRIAAVGHSLGGWTVMATAGARFEEGQFLEDCKTKASPIACNVYNELGVDGTAGAAALLGADLADRRVQAVVSLDLGLARGFTPASLAAVQIPVFVVGAGVEDGPRSAKLESGYLAEYLPQGTSRYLEIADAAHFSFMQICKPGARALIEAETPGDGIVCDDGDGRDRATIHLETAGVIAGFLNTALNVQQPLR
ncbi:hypothetical protein BLJAPNOD_04622 [Ensifer sp. M14]|uniref:alpha/beta hydrolase family protein n=1 Tax=Sinorhizobium/Ensifer group TaxID=227292 RepID=UPI000986F9DF|nr:MULTISPECIES: alpha/beta fold hydrolase [Sinorhizobium/Ensifer group]OOG70288.1 lipoprotein signal peptide [Sinorhizobium sp. A49]RDL48347.1 hypothetical protein BLJAPNOD_04622 [Ensifer sp. M14]